MQAQKSKALPLVTYSAHSGYSLNPDAISMLRMLPDVDSYSVVSTVGKSKTGKSFLLNQLIEDQDMFSVSSHLGNCTKGIMIATKFIEVDSMKVLFLDTEGFGSTEGTDDRDCKLFILSILLSTVVIYNSLGTIDEQTLNSLSMIIEVGKMFEKELENKKSIPALLWALRDFSLQLEDKNGFAISASQYLQSSLEEQKGSSQIINNKNRIRRVIKEVFTQRSCQTLVLPNEETPNENSTLKKENIRKQFIADLTRFKKKLTILLGKKGKKEFCGQNMTISTFIQAVQIYVDCFNKSMRDGSMPKIENLTYQLRQNQAQSIQKALEQHLREREEELVEKIIQARLQSGSEALEREKELLSAIQKQVDKAKNNLYQLTGKSYAQELEKKKNHYLQHINKKCENILRQYEEQNEKENNEDENKTEINNLCEFFSHILDEHQLDHEYSVEIHKLKEKGIKSDSYAFANMLMKLEIAYLRRKAELNKEVSLQVERVSMELEYAKKQIKRLENRNKELEQALSRQPRSVYITPIKGESYNSRNESSNNKNRNLSTFGKQPGYIRTINQGNEITESKSKQLWKHQSSSKIESSSFYVPYILIHKSEYLCSKIVRTLIKEDSKRNNYIEYVIEVSLQGQKWSLNRKFKDFSELHSILVMMFQDEKLPQCKSIVGPLKLADSNSSSRKQVVEQRRRELENYLSELILNESIRNSRILQKFLKINKEYTVL